MPHNSKNGWKYIRRVRAIEFYKNDVRLRYEVESAGKGYSTPKRSKIVEFTMDSRRKLAFTAANTEVNFTHMVTLTYPKEFETDGKMVKVHLNRFLSWLRAKVEGVEYLWFLEFQKRGAPHYHILINRAINKAEISIRWYKAVGSFDVNHLCAGTRIERVREEDGARRYAVKYAMKMEQKRVPAEYRNVGRFWGNSKGVKPESMVVVDGLTMHKDGVMKAFESWEYVDVLEGTPLGTLYGASEKLSEVADFILNGEGK